ncbi:hypothetical protein L7F22_028199, partial [Adiantum nelumboides]|nr:hypothetical protein [Adiantum nelumboides]
MSDLSRSSSRDSRRSRGSIESRISRYSDEELLEEIHHRGLHSTGESAMVDSDRQLFGSQSRHHTPRYTPQRSLPKETSGCSACCFGGGTSSRPSSSSRPPKYLTSHWSPLVGASQATTPLETPRVSSYMPLEMPIALETPNFMSTEGTPTRHGWSPKETPPETPTFRFPNPHGNIVREDVLFSHMAKERHRSNVGKWSQQREARRVQVQTQGTHKLGSEGKARFKALFKEAVDRYPTQQEVMRGRAIGLSALLEELAASGTQVKNVDVRQVSIDAVTSKTCKFLSIIYDLMQADYIYNESIDAVTNMGPPLLSQTGEYPDFVERTLDDEDEDDEDYLPTDEEECKETSESE